MSHGYLLEHRPVRRIEVTMSTTYRCPEGTVDRWAVFPPAFPELLRQRGIKLTFTPEATPVQDGGALKQKVHIIRAAGKPKGFEAKLHCEMTLYTNRLVPLLAGQARPKVELTPADTKIFTHNTPDMATKIFKDFVAKHKLNRGAKESELDFAGRTFLVISKEFTYLYPNIEGKDVIECGKGDCGALSWLFVRVLRANHIPARLLLGHWADSETPVKTKGRPPRRPSSRQGGILRPGPRLGRCRPVRRRRQRERQPISLLRKRSRRFRRLRPRHRPPRQRLAQRPARQARRHSGFPLVVPGQRQEHSP